MTRPRLADLFDLPPLLDMQATADLLGIHVDTVREVFYGPDPPCPVVRLGRAVRVPAAGVLLLALGGIDAAAVAQLAGLAEALAALPKAAEALAVLARAAAALKPDEGTADDDGLAPRRGTDPVRATGTQVRLAVAAGGATSASSCGGPR